ncbi:MAG: alpha-glucan family phosphorylase [Syntrophales bacterium]|jgi:phosphorylase/glycogen(starch) synthase|nr:alpha-glucan family phosphorylase [Syntrophales bacterium]MCK9528498.1 alpha-glucan family phosphorylase [Syntrophales bacterium]MDX9923035.1 alpha-glucan family phosphorylase [Syntrophales bacterium]
MKIGKTQDRAPGDNPMTRCLFEVSWEVCNKAGNIYRVLKTKTVPALESFGDGYILIGPDRGTNPDFEETDEKLWDHVRYDAASRNLSCRCGRWKKVPGSPRVILVAYNETYDVDKLLFGLWQKFGVNSMMGGWDYKEPVLFGTAAGAMIQILHERLLGHYEQFIAHFHGWTSGAGILYLNEHVPEIATVFTLHSTVVGEALADSGEAPARIMATVSAGDMASKAHVSAEYSIEAVASGQADCLTAVSDVVAEEAVYSLGRTPRIILPNGLDLDSIPDCLDDVERRETCRDRFFQFASKFLQKELRPDEAFLLLVSGRYNYERKGLGLVLESLKSLNDALREDPEARNVVAFLAMISSHQGVSSQVRRIIDGAESAARSGINRICTHHLSDPQNDPIWIRCEALNLLNSPDDRVNIIFMPAYLDGYDGLLNSAYDDILKACDLGVFPSLYESWGYTPAESAAYCLPTVTTDRSGFGLWVRKNIDDAGKGVIVLDSREHTRDEIVASLAQVCSTALSWSPDERHRQRNRARSVAGRADWRSLYSFYDEAYVEAVRTAVKRIHGLDTSDSGREITYPGTDSLQPRYRSFSVAAPLPEPIQHLRDIAYDLTWTWTPEIEDIFARLDPQLWAELSRNPVEMLERVGESRLREMAENESYLRHYRRVSSLLDEVHADSESFMGDEPFLTARNPVAYFSTEYGLHESLPIYSGGLGILSGDHLKSADNLKFPLVGVGLLYKHGYFSQTLDREGNQVALYPENDFSRMPLRICLNGGRSGDPVKIDVDLPGRKLYAQAWQITVGSIRLYLLDTAIPDNNSQDMTITSRLYSADQRLRIEQEIMLGIGGVRLLEKLGIRPSVFHLNEGHSAFLLLERIRRLIEKRNLTFHEAKEVVRASSVFTTHSPVEAANERFEEPLMKSYFADYIEEMDISWDTFWQLGRDEPGPGKPFMMPVLAFNLSCASNAVSRLHCRVARKMWKKVWSGFDEDEIPIKAITNGVHMQSWVAPEMKECYERYLGIDWLSKDFEKLGWDRTDEIPDKVLWQIHGDLKKKMVDFLKHECSRYGERQGIHRALVRRKTESLDPDALIIGFARRFAAYKRALMIFEDGERLLRILNNAPGPVHFVFTGKAHPSDEAGRALLKQLYTYTWDERFVDKVHFIENYNVGTARQLVQGVDLWLNNPLRPREASGTSGMKVVVNGGLNLSILDGWWDEAYAGDNGWSFGGGREFSNVDTQNMADSDSFYDILESSVIPTYFEKNGSGLPERWIAMMKGSIRSVVPHFNTHRMIKQYCEEMYLPAARRAELLEAKGYEKARALADWKQKIPFRFSRDHIRWYKVSGFTGDRLNVGETFRVEAGVSPGKLSEEEVRVELVIMEAREQDVLTRQDVVVMTKTDADEAEGTLVFAGEYRAEKAGTFVYGIRIIPVHPDLFSYQETGLVHWA